MGEKRDNSGTLGVNRRKEKDNHPSHSGQCRIDGKDYWISAWVKSGEDGSRFFSLAFKLKEPKPEKTEGEPQKDFDDDIPFAWAALIPLGLVLTNILS